MKLATAFLSHSSKQRDFAVALAEQLGRRGVIPWLDIDEVLSGADLPSALRKAVEAQAVIAVLLTADSACSEWVEQELQPALQRAPQVLQSARVVPISFGNPRALIQGHRLLRDKWLHANGKDVTVLYIDADNHPVGVTPEAHVAQHLAQAVYQAIGTRTSHSIAIQLDQRAHGSRPRTGRPHIPEAIVRLDAPTLVFRPDRLPYSDKEVIYSNRWEALAADVIEALSEAIGPRNSGPQDVYLCGDAQLSWPFLLGHRFFDRRCGRRLFCYNPERLGDPIFPVHFERDRLPAPSNANHDLLGTWEGGVAPTVAPKIFLYIGRRKYLKTVKDFIQAEKVRSRRCPLLSFTHGEALTKDAVLQLIADVIASIEYWQEHCQLEQVQLLCDLPFGAMPILGAYLVNVLNGGISFMEYRKDLQAARPPTTAAHWYTELSMQGLP